MSELPEFGLKDEYRTNHFRQDRLRAKKGPSRWNEVKDDKDAYGDFDFRIMDGNVFMPASVACQQWIYEHFPETCRYFTDLDGWVGVVVEGRLETILERAARDGLLSETDYERNQLNEQLHWETRGE